MPVWYQGTILQVNLLFAHTDTTRTNNIIPRKTLRANRQTAIFSKKKIDFSEKYSRTLWDVSPTTIRYHWYLTMAPYYRILQNAVPPLELYPPLIVLLF